MNSDFNKEVIEGAIPPVLTRVKPNTVKYDCVWKHTTKVTLTAIALIRSIKEISGLSNPSILDLQYDKIKDSVTITIHDPSLTTEEEISK